MTETPSSGSALTFTYDPAGEGSTPLLIDDGTNAYIYGPLLFGGSAPVEQISLSSSSPSYLSAIQSGVQLTFASNGTLTNESSYSPYGVQTNTVGSQTPFGFQGSYTDPSGLVYLIHRYYDPATAQFLTVDPGLPETGQPYEFVGDNPVNQSDPLGLMLLCNSVDLLVCLSPDNNAVPTPTGGIATGPLTDENLVGTDGATLGPDADHLSGAGGLVSQLRTGTYRPGGSLGPTLGRVIPGATSLQIPHPRRSTYVPRRRTPSRSRRPSVVYRGGGGRPLYTLRRWS